jgi:lipoprotein-anchoring transpeptidase ErfK/SrfK
MNGFMVSRLLLTCVLLLGAGSAHAQSEVPTDTFELAERYPAGSGTLRLEISKAERELYVYLNDDRIARMPVAIGQPDHPTPSGEFGIHQVDWNPDWTPPDSEWSEDREYKAPGEEGNPMGRARLIYRAPYSLHGTEALESLGTAASHGSVRVANEDIIGLARLVQEHGGAGRSDEWYRNAVASPTEMFEVSLPEPVPVVIRD